MLVFPFFKVFTYELTYYGQDSGMSNVELLLLHRIVLYNYSTMEFIYNG